MSSLPGVSGASSIDKLVSMYMSLERRPIDALNARRDELEVRSAMFTDLKGMLEELRGLAEELSSDTGSVFSSYVATSSDEKVLTATASGSASPGSYLFSNVVTARAHRMQSTAGTGWTAPTDGTFSIQVGSHTAVNISVTAGQTLSDVRAAINQATYESGGEVVATVIDGKLVVEAKSTGSANQIVLANVDGDLLSSIGMTTSQAASDASFTVNGVSVTRASNTGLTDVVSGLTLNLTGSSAAGEDVMLEVAYDTVTVRSKIESFLEKLNALFDYLKGKSAVTKDSSGSYARGPLNGYSLYTDLRSMLASDLTAQVAGVPSGAPSRLYELGIEMDANMHFVVKDSAKLEEWLSGNPEGVAAFFGGASGAATRVFDRLRPYVVDPLGDAKAYLDREQDTIASEQRSIDGRIDALEERLAMREQQLRAQFARLQSLMVAAMQQQQRLQSIFYTGWGF